MLSPADALAEDCLLLKPRLACPNYGSRKPKQVNKAFLFRERSRLFSLYSSRAGQISSGATRLKTKTFTKIVISGLANIKNSIKCTNLKTEDEHGINTSLYCFNSLKKCGYVQSFSLSFKRGIRILYAWSIYARLCQLTSVVEPRRPFGIM